MKKYVYTKTPFSHRKNNLKKKRKTRHWKLSPSWQRWSILPRENSWKIPALDTRREMSHNAFFSLESPQWESQQQTLSCSYYFFIFRLQPIENKIPTFS